MPWIPIDRLPEEAKDGRYVDMWEGGRRYTSCAWNADWGQWLTHDFIAVHPTHFYDFGEGRITPDAPEGE